MSMDGAADYVVKPQLIKDTVSLLEVEPYNEYVVSNQCAYSLTTLYALSLFSLKQMIGKDEEAIKENLILQFAVLLQESEHASEG